MSSSHHPLTFKGDPLTLLGDEVKAGSNVPDFALIGNDMNEVTLKDFKGKTLVISSVPSLDTPVCSIETKKFSEELKRFPNALFLTVSRDLPFAQKRWCLAEDVNHGVTASDYKYQSFGDAFGVYIEEWGLLSRAVFVVDKNGKVTYAEYVPEVSSEPNYEAVIGALKKLS